MEVLFVITMLGSLILAIISVIEEKNILAGIFFIAFVLSCIATYVVTNTNKADIIQRQIETTELKVSDYIKIMSDKPVKYIYKIQKYKSWSVLDEEIIEIKIVDDKGN